MCVCVCLLVEFSFPKTQYKVVIPILISGLLFKICFICFVFARVIAVVITFLAPVDHFLHFNFIHLLMTDRNQ